MSDGINRNFQIMVKPDAESFQWYWRIWLVTTPGVQGQVIDYGTAGTPGDARARAEKAAAKHVRQQETDRWKREQTSTYDYTVPRT